MHSSLRVIGYFAILESLLTHNPRPIDPYDSLTRQVTQEMALLDRRFNRSLEYGGYFGHSKPETIWKKLYDVRSSLAHGSRADFARDFQVLGSLEKVTTFVQMAARKVMRRALEEPTLVADLRNYTSACGAE